MLSFTRGIHHGLNVQPRFPSSVLCISETAWDRLLQVQDQLPAEIRLIITRGYEPRASSVGAARKLFRAIGIKLFRLVFRARKHEINDIFGANGHDVDGSHVDVSLALNQKRLRFLPLGVFTPIPWQNKRTRAHEADLQKVMTALMEHGFQIHRNQTESLQIHCDLI